MVRFLGFHILVNHKNIPFFSKIASTSSSWKRTLLKKTTFICVREITFKMHPFFAKLGTILRTHWSVRVTPPGIFTSIIYRNLHYRQKHNFGDLGPTEEIWSKLNIRNRFCVSLKLHALNWHFMLHFKCIVVDKIASFVTLNPAVKIM